MTKILTKQIQNKLSSYFSKLSSSLYKPEARMVREMVTGILKSGTVLVNQIAVNIQDKVSLSKTTKRFRTHYNKEGFNQKLTEAHLNSVKGKIHHEDYILVDGSDIQKQYAKMMEGLDIVKDGDKSKCGPGYWLINAVHFGKDGELTPLVNKLYSFDHGAKSENLEVQELVNIISSNIDKRLKYIYDRGMDRSILRDFIISREEEFILRLKKNTKLIYKSKEVQVQDIAKKIPLFMDLTADKIKKNKKSKKTYHCGAVKVQYDIKGEEYYLWLVVTRNTKGGYSYLLTNSSEENIVSLIKETFTAYGYRWKIEEYHRHIKSSYNLEDIQIKKFEGLQTMLTILSIAMAIVYRELSSLHIKLLLESGVKTLNKNKIYELYNFIYYKISKILKVLLAHFTPRAFLPDIQTDGELHQLRLAL